MVGTSLLNADERRLLRDAVAKAEAETSGEIYVVIDHAADDFRLVPILWAALVALLLPWLLLISITLGMTSILIFQAVGFVTTAIVLSAPGILWQIIPGAIADEAVHRTARAVFLAQGVHMTERRTGVLIYASAPLHRVEILADNGIHACVEDAQWSSIIATIVAEARRGNLVRGIAAAIEKVGVVLARHYPRESYDRNELPNRVVEM